MSKIVGIMHVPFCTYDFAANLAYVLYIKEKKRKEKLNLKLTQKKKSFGGGSAPPIWPRGWLNRLPLFGQYGIPNHPCVMWGGRITPICPNGGGRNHPKCTIKIIKKLTLNGFGDGQPTLTRPVWGWFGQSGWLGRPLLFFFL